MSLKNGEFVSCGYCSKEFYASLCRLKQRDSSKLHQLFCNLSCKSKYVGKLKANGAMFPCSVCEKLTYKTLYQQNKNKNIVCSPECRAKSKITKELKKCDFCGKDIHVHLSIKAKNNFCDRQCCTDWKKQNASSINQHLNKKVLKTCLFCKKDFRAHLYRADKAKYCSISCKGKDVPEEKHSSWLGDEAGYGSIHRWVSKHKGKAKDKNCSFCKKQADDWANLDGYYKRKLDDYIPLCRSCHNKYDNNMRGNGSKSGNGFIEKRFKT